MKKPMMRFEAVPLAEVFSNAVVKPMGKAVEKQIGKEGPYLVHERLEQPKCAHARNSNSSEETREAGQNWWLREQ
jgi:hypothetical protein